MSIKMEMLRYFCTVAQAGNLAEAADRLGRSQSAISMMLKQLEDHLGKKLFEGERKNQLSPLGEQVFELALKQLRQFDQTVENIEQTARAERGLIRIVAVPSVAAIVFPPVLNHMAQRHPGLKVELRDTDTQQVIDALSEGRADVGIASGAHRLNGIQSTLLFEDRFGLVCANTHPLAQQTAPPSIKQVVQSSFVQNALSKQILSPRFSDATGGTDITIQNTHSLIAMVRTGHWATVLPQTVMQFVPPNIVFREILDLPDRRQVYLYQRENTRFKSQTEECCALIESLGFAAGRSQVVE
ncbi:MAG: LysR family transcriptional regulator [Pseudoruegeria sp.]